MVALSQAEHKATEVLSGSVVLEWQALTDSCPATHTRINTHTLTLTHTHININTYTH